MLSKWRLVLDPPLPGLVNMERDINIMNEMSEGGCPPTLRLYRWSPPAVSIGHFQDEEKVVNRQACRELGLDLVRRPTGGRAVIHADELTYSIVVPETDPFTEKGGVIDVYRAISRGIVNAFSLLNITASMAPASNERPTLAPGSCFDTPSAYEVQVKGKKVVGSAQLRRDGVILQHGSILFSLAEDLYQRVLINDRFKGNRDNGSKLSQMAAGLLDLGYVVSYDDMTRALVKAFSRVIPAVFSSYVY